jgi:hypothetical protein
VIVISLYICWYRVYLRKRESVVYIFILLYLLFELNLKVKGKRNVEGKEIYSRSRLVDLTRVYSGSNLI